MMKKNILILWILVIFNSGCKQLNKATEKQNQDDEIQFERLPTEKVATKNIVEWLEILPDRYVNFSCENGDRKNLFDNPDIVKIEHNFLCLGLYSEEADLMPGEVCFSVKTFPFKDRSVLFVVTNEKFDGVCTEFDNFFLTYSKGEWIEIPVNEIFEMNIQNYEFYYPKNKLPELYQHETSFFPEYMMKLNSSNNSIMTTLSICDYMEEEEANIYEKLVAEFWTDLKVLEFHWNETRSKFVVKFISD